MANGADPAVEARCLRKSFGAVRAVDGLSLTVGRGEIVGLLGPNGAGKTTTIQILLGLTTPDAGEISILGLDPRRRRREVLARVNFSAAYTCMPTNLTVWENLNVYALLYGVPDRKKKIAELLARLKIVEAKRQVTGMLSSGQLTRLNLCKALLNDPEVLFLDEPTASLDPDIADTVRATLLELRRERGMSMLYTSHNMHEVEELCDRVIFLHRGREVTRGTPAEVTRAMHEQSLTGVFVRIARGGAVESAGEPDAGCR